MTTIDIPHMNNYANADVLAEVFTELSKFESFPFTFQKYASQEEWLEARRHTIGASEAAAVLGISPYKSRQQLFDEKLGRRTNVFEGNELTRIGQAEEPLIRALWAIEHPGYDVYDGTNIIFRSKARPWQSCSLDMVAIEQATGKIFIGEIKTGNRASAWEGDYVPPAYFAQLCHQLAVTGFDGAFLISRIRRDAAIMDRDLTCTARERSYFYDAHTDAVHDEVRRVTEIESKFVEDMEKRQLRPLLNLSIF